MPGPYRQLACINAVVSGNSLVGVAVQVGDAVGLGEGVLVDVAEGIAVAVFVGGSVFVPVGGSVGVSGIGGTIVTVGSVDASPPQPGRTTRAVNSRNA